MSEQTL